MNDADKAEIASRYRARLAEHGASSAALATGTPERQEIRFGVLAGVGDLEGATVLDLGCGFGEFYQYLLSKGVRVNYTGYDITPEFIDHAKKRFPEAHFEVRDVQVDGIAEKFDYVVSSQTFNNRLAHEGNMELMQDVLRISYEACEKGVSIDMFTSYVDFREDRLFYYSPEEIFRFSKTLTKRVLLRHDYPLFEFTVYLYRDFSGWKK
ncbi:MAG: class I SAM-dependent methyltransferase [Chthoniobacteraceae bacterium]